VGGPSADPDTDGPPANAKMRRTEGKTGLFSKPCRDRSDHGREEGACSKDERELELNDSTAPARAETRRNVNRDRGENLWQAVTPQSLFWVGAAVEERIFEFRSSLASGHR